MAPKVLGWDKMLEDLADEKSAMVGDLSQEQTEGSILQ